MAAALGSRQLFPRFQALVSLRALPSQQHLLLVGEAPLATSWNAACRAHFYVPADVLEREEQAVPMLARFLCSGGSCSLPAMLQWPAGSVVRLPRSRILRWHVQL